MNEELITYLSKEFGKLDSRFDKIDARFTKVDERFDKIDARFTKVDERFDKIDVRFTKVDERFDKIEEDIKEMKQSISTNEINIKDIKESTNDMKQSISANETNILFGFKEAKEERANIMTRIDRIYNAVDGFVNVVARHEDEFTIMKEDVNRIKRVIKEKLEVDLL